MSSEALALCNTIDIMSVSSQVLTTLFLNAEKFSEVVFGTREPSIFGAIFDAIETGLSAARKAGDSPKGSSVASAAASAGTSVGNSIWPQLNLAQAWAQRESMGR